MAYATNGHEILEIDLATGGANSVSEFPAPQELWSFMGLGGGEGWVEAFSLVPFWFDAVKHPRYYQELAVNRVTDASRILGDLKLIRTGFATLQRAVYAA